MAESGAELDRLEAAFSDAGLSHCLAFKSYFKVDSDFADFLEDYNMRLPEEELREIVQQRAAGSAKQLARLSKSFSQSSLVAGSPSSLSSSPVSTGSPPLCRSVAAVMPPPKRPKLDMPSTMSQSASGQLIVSL